MPTTKKVASKASPKKVSHVLTVRADKSKTPSKTKKFSIVRKTTKSKEVAAPPVQKVVEPFFEKQTTKSLQIKPTFALAIRSPFRFPINTDKLALQTARYGGVFFMAIGALFTLFFANGSFGSVGQQVASVKTTQINTVINTNSTTTANCEDPLQYESSTCGSLINKKPPISFEVVGSPTALVGTVSVHATVAHAKHVTLVAYSKSLNKVIELGSMTNVSSNVWEYSWNTLTVNDGSYRLKAYVQNFYGAYDTTDTTTITVDNVPLQTETPAPTVPSTVLNPSTTDSSVASGTTTTTVSAQLATSIELLETQNVNQFRFKITTPVSTKSVKLYVRNGAVTSVLGYAYKASDTTWLYRWDTTAVAVGSYEVKAVAIQADAVQLTTDFLSVNKTAVDGVEVVPTVQASSTDEKPVLKPTVTFDIQSGQALNGIITLKLDVSNATQIELYAQSKSGLIKKFLGNAQSIDTNVWMYQVDTRKMPNGEYTLIASVKNQYGMYEAQSATVKVANEVVIATTPKEEDRIKTLTDIAKQVKKEEASSTVPVEKKASVLRATTTSDLEPVADTEEETAHNLFVSFKVKIDSELQLLASALRLGDAKAVEASKSRLATVKREIIAADIKSSNTEKLIEIINSKIEIAIAKVETDVKNTAKIIAERSTEKASLDSDKDGITDYDEVAIYKTNPFKVDSDSDGFNDGAEILSGHNPADATPETLVAYESPQETGIVREDILEVKSIATALQDGPQTDTKQKKAEAIITGKALPNSFVTLYIFSTPIVVTLKTDSDGSWNYRFDKELEDGEHQVYVGVTDNAGKIVAKSKPFSFVKVAEAFSPVAGEVNVATPVAVPEKSFLSEYMIYLVLSISVVAIGLVLILLGLHLDTRQRTYGIQTEKVEKPA